MKRILLVLVALISLAMLGGRTIYWSNTYEHHYFGAIYDDSVTADTDAISGCRHASAAAETAGEAWCIMPSSRQEVLRSWTIVVIAALTTAANEDCSFVIETSSDLSTWVEVASSEINVGENVPQQENPFACEGSDGGDGLVNDAGDYCTRTLDEGVFVPSGGAWRVAINENIFSTCLAVEGLAYHVVSIAQ